MARISRLPKGMSVATYKLMVDLNLTDDEIHLVFRMMFNDICDTYDVHTSSKNKVKKKKVPKKEPTPKEWVSDPEWQKRYDQDWDRQRGEFNAGWGRSSTPSYTLTPLPKETTDKDGKKDQISAASLIKGEAKRIREGGTAESNAARRQRLLEEDKPKKEEEAPRKKRRGEW